MSSLKAKLLKKVGITHLHPFQESIVEFFKEIEGPDLVIHAPTGTGKTLAFVLGFVLRLNIARHDKVFAIVLVPTKALVHQTKSLIELLAGRRNIYRKIFVDTPEAFFNSDKVSLLSEIRYLVIDEADRLANELYKDYLSCLRRPSSEYLKVPSVWNSKCKRLLCSATYNPEGFYDEMFDLANPESISYDASLKVEELVIKCDEKSKFKHFENFFTDRKHRKILVFVNSLATLKSLLSQLKNVNCTLLKYYSDLPANLKAEVIHKFSNSSEFTILVSTDALSRGVDLKECDLVVNYSMPKSRSTYVHRIGRTGRGSSSGTALSFINNPREDKVVKQRKVTILKADM